MKVEPLKGKGVYCSDREEMVWVKEDFEKVTDDVVYEEKDIASAVEWLKQQLDSEQDRELVNEAFEDVIKEE